ncbi:MAG: hypothetical protein E6J78_02200 [Deltaproteobacteria bacterium]|nr:MAG: hypothetical protein E6J78_02200 [Deltaproteobacteria bacterium]
MTFEEFAAREWGRAQRSGRWFSIARIAPVGWRALDEEIDALACVVEAHLRRTDFVQRKRDREVSVVLVETLGASAGAALERVRENAVKRLPELQLRIGCAPARPDQQWQEAWRWAGRLLVADAAVPAAA